MSINFSNQWRQYKKLIDTLYNLNAQLAIFPNKQSVKDQIKELRKQLFEDYQGFINSNNSINKVVLRTTIKDWFSKNCKLKSPQEVEEWLNSKNLDNYNIVRYVADDLIGQEMCQLCFKGGRPYCPQTKGDEKGCAKKIISEIIHNSDRYTHIPNTEENYNLFINGGTQFLQKEVKIQEENPSPIEEIMYEAIKPILKKYGFRAEREYPVYDTGRFEIRYSLDILISNQNNKPVLNIECDGLSYHNSYESMTSDRARDRWLLIRGIPTMRFTSREIFNELDNCVIQIESALKSLTSK